LNANGRFKNHPFTAKDDVQLNNTRCLPYHAEYPVFSVGANFFPDTAGHMALKPM
jgi:hypothetical protein